MQTLNINGFKVKLNNEVQISKKGREMRLSGCYRVATKAEKWVKEKGVNVSKSHWVYIFRFLDKDEFIGFEFDYYDKFVGACVSENAGRKKLNNVLYQRRIKPAFVELMDSYLKELKNKL